MAKKTKTTTTAPKPYRARRFGIQNNVGGVWTPETFHTKEEAQGYLERQRKAFLPIPNAFAKHKVVPVRVTVSIVQSR